MDVCLAIKQRLEKLGLEQRDLAAAEVTESYISQLLTRKKSPPALNRMLRRPQQRYPLFVSLRPPAGLLMVDRITGDLKIPYTFLERDFPLAAQDSSLTNLVYCPAAAYRDSAGKILCRFIK